MKNKRILLPFLMLASAFFSACAMEKSREITLIGVNNQEICIPLELAQRSNFLNGLMDGFSQTDGHIDLARIDVPAFLTTDIIQKLKDLYSGATPINAIPDEQIPVLFAAAHWFNFEHQILNTLSYERSFLAKLARRCFDMLADSQANEDLHRIRGLARDFLPCYRTVEELIDTQTNAFLKTLYDSTHGILDLSYTKLGKKLQSLEGIGALMDIIGDQPVIILDVHDQNISTLYCDMFNNERFPKLRQINLSGNHITRVTQESLMHMPAQLILNLRNNQITEIEPECFNTFDRFNQTIIHLEGNLLTAAQLQETFRNGAITACLNPAHAGVVRMRRILDIVGAFTMGGLSTGAGTGFLFGPLLAKDYFYKHNYDKFFEPYLGKLTRWSDYASKKEKIIMLMALAPAYYYCWIRPFWRFMTRTLSIAAPHLQSDALQARLVSNSPYHLYVTTDHGNFDFPTIYSIN